MMIILIAGATHTGKTKLAQTLLENYKYPYLSIDHLKMGLIRSKNTSLTPYDDDNLTEYLWNIVKEIIKTAIENQQNLIIEGAYIPFDWQGSFSKEYLEQIKYVCLIMTKKYIKGHFEDIRTSANSIEKRLNDEDLSPTILIAENEKNLEQCKKYELPYILIDEKYDLTSIDSILFNNEKSTNDSHQSIEAPSMDQRLDQYSEGSIELKNLLKYLWDNGISTGACCSGIKEYHTEVSKAQPYILIYLDKWEHSDILPCIEKLCENKEMYISHCSPLYKAGFKPLLSILSNKINVSVEESDNFFRKIYLTISDMLNKNETIATENVKSKFYDRFTIPAVRKFSEILHSKLMSEKKYIHNEKLQKVTTPIIEFNLYYNYNREIRPFKDDELKKNMSLSFYNLHNLKWYFYEKFYDLNDDADYVKIEKWLRIYRNYLKNIH